MTPASKFHAPAHDLPRVALADIDLTHAEAIGVRMLADLEHATDAEEIEVRALVRHPDPHDPLHLRAADRELARNSLGGHVDIDVFAQP